MRLLRAVPLAALPLCGCQLLLAPALLAAAHAQDTRTRQTPVAQATPSAPARPEDPEPGYIADARAAEERRQAAVREKTEKERLQVEASAALERTLAQLQGDPKPMQLVYSSVICRWLSLKGRAKNEIATQKKYAREGAGVVNLGDLYAEQARMRRADERIARATEALAEYERKPLPCKNEAVLSVVLCVTGLREAPSLDEEFAEDCGTREMTMAIELVYRADGWLRP